MTKKNFTSILFVLDKSASMTSKRSATISAFDEFVEDQKNQPGECHLTLVQFDTTYGVILSNIDIKDVMPLEEIGYAPGGNTALLDATARAINEAGDIFKRMDESERPDNVVLVVLTDGEENSSREVTHKELTDLIDHQVEKYDWKVVYLGQGSGAWAEAGRMGLQAKAAHHANYFAAEMKTGGGGILRGAKAAAYAVSSTRSSGSKRMDKGGTSDLLNADDGDAADKAYDDYRKKQAVRASDSSAGGDA